MELEKAKLQEIKADKSAKPVGDPVDVQFNPTTMKLQLSSNLSSGDSTGSQTRQSSGSTSATLSFDLVFDTADEGETGAPRSVFSKTAAIQKFVTPASAAKGKQKPPKLRFIWGAFQFDGVVESINIDLELFAANGTPLRAKVAVSVKGQDPKLVFAKTNQQGNAPTPLQNTGAGPGAASSGAPAGPGRVAPALEGESLPEFAARNGLDPSAWRALNVPSAALGSLSLPAGVEVGFDEGLSVSAGIGVSAGIDAGISASLEASFGLEASAGLSAVAGAGVSAELSAGFSLSAAGGVTAAIESVKQSKSDTSQQKAREAFGAPAGGSTAAASPAATQARTPLKDSGIPSPAAQADAPAAPPPPRADARATTFGFGVPLRPVFNEAQASRLGTVSGNAPLREQAGSTLPPVTFDPATPPWVALPARPAATRGAAGTKTACRCGCTQERKR